MPTDHDYRLAAMQLRSQADRLARDWSMLRTATEVGRIAGGDVGALLEQSLESVRSELERTGAELDRLAAICEHRAEICAAHAADLRRHRALVTTVGGWISPPPAPAWWVST